MGHTIHRLVLETAYKWENELNAVICLSLAVGCEHNVTRHVGQAASPDQPFYLEVALARCFLFGFGCCFVSPAPHNNKKNNIHSTHVFPASLCVWFMLVAASPVWDLTSPQLVLSFKFSIR